MFPSFPPPKKKRKKRKEKQQKRKKKQPPKSKRVKKQMPSPPPAQTTQPSRGAAGRGRSGHLYPQGRRRGHGGLGRADRGDTGDAALGSEGLMMDGRYISQTHGAVRFFFLAGGFPGPKMENCFASGCSRDPLKLFFFFPLLVSLLICPEAENGPLKFPLKPPRRGTLKRKGRARMARFSF